MTTKEMIKFIDYLKKNDEVYTHKMVNIQGVDGKKYMVLNVGAMSDKSLRITVKEET